MTIPPPVGPDPEAPLSLNVRDTSIGFVSTYPPTVCGLATFTDSLLGSIARPRGPRHRLGVLRQLANGQVGRPSEGVQMHRHGDRRSLAAATRFLNRFDAVSIQHEFGIYGGADGREVLDLVERVEAPIATTFHTVLAAPTAHQRTIVEQLAARSERAVVMSETAARLLTEHYAVDPHRVTVIPHGAAERFAGPSLAAGDRPLILTWGLIGPGKGLEMAIEACAGLVDLVPQPRYLIAGATHPNVRATQGEAYRDGLVTLVERLGLGDVVEFDDRYLAADELAKLVRSADLVVLPYASTEQVTSGVLVEAISASKPVIATTFPHSTEVLSTGAGMLVPHDDPGALGDAMRTAITDRGGAERMTREAHRIAQGWYWPTVGARYERLFEQLVADAAPQRPFGRRELVHHAAS